MSYMRGPGETGNKAVKYTPCNKGDQTDEDELDEIAVVGASDEPQQSQEQEATGEPQAESEDQEEPTVNGPRTLPGGGYMAPSDRTRLIEGDGRTGSSGTISVATSHRVSEGGRKTESRHSLMDLVSHRIERLGQRKSHCYTRDDIAFLNKARANEYMTQREIRKMRRKEIDEKFGKKYKMREKIELAEKKIDTGPLPADKDGCRWTFVFDPSGRLAYWWSFVVSIAFVYNFWVIVYRFAFAEINKDNIIIWFPLDYTADLVYILDILFHFRTGFLDEGVLQTDSTKLRIHYMNTTVFYVDCLCLLPLDFLYLSIGFKSMLRCFRLVKIYRYWAWLDRTERHTNYPNFIRTTTLLHYLFAIFHWNACLHYIVADSILKSDLWQYNLDKDKDVLYFNYLKGLYWSTCALTTVGDLPRPETPGEFGFYVIQIVFGLLLFASVLGHVANIVASISTARKDFQAKLDGVKTYMSLRRVPMHLQERVIRWFDYLWTSHKSSDEDKVLNLLPDKLKAEIAIHVHLDTLKRVEIFQNTDPGFLCELVLRLRPVLFSPGDYICRKGEVGKDMYILSRGKLEVVEDTFHGPQSCPGDRNRSSGEIGKDMYIVNRGRLQVVGDNGRTVLATLKPGSYFGEISILNMGTAGNRRTASVRSVGYSDLFCLSKQDMWDVLKEYPAARVKLEAIAVKRLEKYKKAPLEKVAVWFPGSPGSTASLARSKSTPGLVESAGKIPLEHMQMTGDYPSLNPRPSRDHHSCSDISGEAPPSTTSDCNAQGHTTGPTEEKSAIDSGHTAPPTPYITELSQGEPPKFSLTPPSTPMSGHSPLPTTVVPNIGVSPPNITESNHGSPGLITDNIPLQSFGAPYSTTATLQMSPISMPLLSPGGYGGAGSSYRSSTSNLLSPALSPNLTHHSLSPNQPLNTLQSMSPHMASSSTCSLARDPSSDILLQEISRLRERLVALETENATMSIKLNQSQWEVEQRLSEIEMHICGSDSIGSGGSGDNKESVI
ncbi:cGMP-gated cation channel alpha-1-like isoform X2 [Lineus longissimus]|uniref:cGMP-gated cation channel alpha-1-like isoform X2 n=1 Tax=Lineus longissimus TaxID=88925 RepID=UPI00315CFF00